MILSNYTFIIEDAFENPWIDFFLNHLNDFLEKSQFNFQKLDFYKLLSHKEEGSFSMTMQMNFKDWEQFQTFLDKEEYLLFEEIDKKFEGKYLYFNSFLEKINQTMAN